MVLAVELFLLDHQNHGFKTAHREILTRKTGTIHTEGPSQVRNLIQGRALGIADSRVEQTALVGQVQTEINCLPVENAEYKRTMDARAKIEMSKPRRQTKQVEGTEGSMYTAGGLGQSNAFETGFTSVCSVDLSDMDQELTRRYRRRRSRKDNVSRLHVCPRTN